MPPEESPKIMSPEQLKELIAAFTPKQTLRVRQMSAYYKEEIALEIKAYLDEMITDKKDKILLFERFNYKPATLNLYVCHGWAYLIKELDTPDKIYETLREQCRVKEEATGITIRWTGKEAAGDTYKKLADAPPEVVASNNKEEDDEENIFKLRNWMSSMQEWMKSPTLTLGDMFERSNLRVINEKEEQWLQGIVGGGDDFLYKIFPCRTKLFVIKNG